MKALDVSASGAECLGLRRQAATREAGPREENVGSREKSNQGGNCSLLWTPSESPIQIVTSWFLATVASFRADDKREKDNGGFEYRM